MTFPAGGPGLFSLDEILEAAGGVPIAGSGPWADVTDVAIDSRKIQSGALFVALKGERTDGHDHVAEAVEHGARALLVSEERARAIAEMLRGGERFKGIAAVAVKDPLAGLQALARFHMRKLPSVTRIGVTGSNGKTTTKEIIGAILSIGAPTAVNEGNLNSEIGLPLACFSVESGHRYAIFEMGMNRRGEMDVLAGIVHPGLALITNIGTAHIGILGSKADIAIEKKVIFSRFTGGQTGFLNEKEPFAPTLAADVKGRIVFFGPRSTQGFRGSESLGLDGTCIDWEGSRIRFPLFGAHNLENALGAISVARELSIPAAQIREGLESVPSLFGRSQIYKGPVTVVFDGYNANPDSMERAIAFVGEVEWPGRKIAVLGGMRELGGESAGAHRTLGAKLAGARFDEVLLYGDEMVDAWGELAATPAAGHSSWTPDFAVLAAALKAMVKDGDLVLIKGSRGMEMERLLPELARSPHQGGGAPKGRVHACS
jgi:UDP-N-acetylmuramoyl-tripeptide--D-alanyl-D-alanine ligase